MESTEVTQLLGRVAQGDKVSENRLLEVVYSELKRLATQAMRRERKDRTLQPSALVNEAYCRLAGTQRIPGKVATTFTPPPPKRPNAAV